ncbi:hypothetical protein [Paenibacillus tepidiphilus]|uniref:hypothetical protein n=1 Tax=Paenibacillus tepidiphilus TaxID=2608683 RepID=UPI00123AA28D|nr:hypothetical protein [Paenibacillus tepidiphilus]
MSDNNVDMNKSETENIIIENSNCICKKDNIDFEVIYTDCSKLNSYKLDLLYENDQLHLVSLEYTYKEIEGSFFMENYSIIMKSMFIEDYINYDVGFYRRSLGDKYAVDGYYLSQRILEAYFNRFFT